MSTLDGGVSADGAGETGSSRTALVAAGGRSRSARYVLDQSLGQPSQDRNRSKNGSYLLNGGLIGANGSTR